MESAKRPPEFSLELHADPACAKDMIKGLLHTIFFHRTFTSVKPLDRDILSITLPLVDDPDLETLIDSRATALVRQIESAGAPAFRQQSSQSAAFSVGGGSAGGGGSGGTTASAAAASAGAGGVESPVGKGQLAVQFFERRRRKSYFFGKSADEEVCWEQWNVDVLVFKARTQTEADRLTRVMEESLQKAAMQVINIAGAEKDHIPPITTQEMNPFPYEIILREQGWGKTMGLF